MNEKTNIEILEDSKKIEVYGKYEDIDEIRLYNYTYEYDVIVIYGSKNENNFAIKIGGVDFLFGKTGTLFALEKERDNIKVFINRDWVLTEFYVNWKKSLDKICDIDIMEVTEKIIKTVMRILIGAGYAIPNNIFTFVLSFLQFNLLWYNRLGPRAILFNYIFNIIKEYVNNLREKLQKYLISKANKK